MWTWFLWVQLSTPPPAPVTTTLQSVPFFVLQNQTQGPEDGKHSRNVMSERMNSRINVWTCWSETHIPRESNMERHWPSWAAGGVRSPRGLGSSELGVCGDHFHTRCLFVPQVAAVLTPAFRSFVQIYIVKEVLSHPQSRNRLTDLVNSLWLLGMVGEG